MISRFIISSLQSNSNLLICQRSCIHNTQVDLPFVGKVGRSGVVAGFVGISMAATWFVYRHETWAWPIQDVLSVSLCIHILSVLRFPDAKVRQRARCCCRRRFGGNILLTLWSFVCTIAGVDYPFVPGTCVRYLLGFHLSAPLFGKCDDWCRHWGWAPL